MEEIEEKSLEQQIAEAEERGYRRGLNEQIEKRMAEPALWEGERSMVIESTGGLPDSEFRVLAARNRSVWDD